MNDFDKYPNHWNDLKCIDQSNDCTNDCIEYIVY